MSPSHCLIRYDDNEVARRNTNTISTFKKNYSLGTHNTTIVSESDDLTNFDNAFDKETTTKIDCSKVKATYLTSPMTLFSLLIFQIFRPVRVCCQVAKSLPRLHFL